MSTQQPTTMQNLFGYTDQQGNQNQGSFMPVANTALNAFGAFTSWQSLAEAKKNNEHTRKYNIINSRNSAKDYNATLDDRTRTRMVTGGSSNADIDTYLNSRQHQDRRAESL